MVPNADVRVCNSIKFCRFGGFACFSDAVSVFLRKSSIDHLKNEYICSLITQKQRNRYVSNFVERVIIGYSLLNRPGISYRLLFIRVPWAKPYV